VAHDRAREDVLTIGLAMTGLWPETEWGDLRVAPPTLTYATWLTLHPGWPVELIHPGPAHTTGEPPRPVSSRVRGGASQCT